MYIYQGNGYIPGVPAQDLTNEEAKSFGIPVEGTALYWRDGAEPPEDDTEPEVITDVIDEEMESDDVDSN